MKTLRRVHRWIGLALAIPMLLQGLTGVLMVVLPLTTIRASASVDTAHDDAAPVAEALVKAATVAAPAGLQALSYAPPRWPGDSSEVGFGHVGERRPSTTVAVDPADGHVIAVSHPGWLFGLAHDLHTSLLIPVFGRTVIGWFGLGLLFLGLSGIVLWWPHLPLRISGGWRRQLVVSTRARGRPLVRQIHYALGGWLTVMILLMSVTGAMMSFPRVMNALLHLPPQQGRGPGGPDRRPGRSHSETGEQFAHAPRIPVEQGLDEAIARLSTGLAGPVRIIEIGLQRPPAPFSARVVMPGLANRQMLLVSIDRAGGAPVVTRDPRNQHGGQRVMTLVHQLHEAKLPVPALLGAAWTVIVGLTGAALVLFSVTGVVMWALKRRPGATVKTQAAVERLPVG